MNILDKIENTSFKKLFWTALIIGACLTLPLTVWLIRQEKTSMFSRADFKPPAAERLKHGKAPSLASAIESISPFLGKEGDIVVVKGKNLGYYPEGSTVAIGSTVVPEDHLVNWEDTKISFYLPTGAQSGSITVKAGNFTTSWPPILTVFDTQAQTKVSRQTNSLLIQNANKVKRVVYYDQNERFEVVFDQPLITGQNPQSLVRDLAVTHVSWLTLFDAQDRVLPFYVSPADFDF
jgi:hypothetical protein